MNFEPLLKRPVHLAIAEVARYFQELAPGDTLPKRQEFRPTRIPALLGYYFLMDVLKDGDYHFSLAGEYVAELFGIDATHWCLSQIGNEDMRTRLKQTYDIVVETATFHYVRGHYTWPEHSVGIERLLVPLADNNGCLRAILGVVIPVEPTDLPPVFTGLGAATLEIDEQLTGRKLVYA